MKVFCLFFQYVAFAASVEELWGSFHSSLVAFSEQSACIAAEWHEKKVLKCFDATSASSNMQNPPVLILVSWKKKCSEYNFKGKGKYCLDPSLEHLLIPLISRGVVSVMLGTIFPPGRWRWGCRATTQVVFILCIAPRAFVVAILHSVQCLSAHSLLL